MWFRKWINVFLSRLHHEIIVKFFHIIFKIVFKTQLKISHLSPSFILHIMTLCNFLLLLHFKIHLNYNYSHVVFLDTFCCGKHNICGLSEKCFLQLNLGTQQMLEHNKFMELDLEFKRWITSFCLRNQAQLQK